MILNSTRILPILTGPLVNSLFRTVASRRRSLPHRRHIRLNFTIAIGAVLFGSATLASVQERAPANNQELAVDDVETRQKPTDEPTSFDQNAAFEFLRQICEIGPRVSGTSGMQQQQQLLIKHFQQTGGKAYYQKFNVTHPLNGRSVELKNMMIRWHPERQQRLLICCHYDTRPWPDRDPHNPRGVFIGANDGGSGVALLCELGKHMSDLPGKYGVDFLFFDGEEFVYVNRRDPMFLGSTHFSREYAAGRIDAKYLAGVLVDMVADKNLELYYEGNSLKRAPRVTRSLWEIADRLGVEEFIAKRRHTIRDDHLPLNQIARIPVCDIIDFDFPVQGNSYWHTEQDVIENCSAESLGKVGRVVLQWIREMQGR